MTSGDGERLATEPVTPANSGEDAAASAAALCSDSDDLLTTRRGGLPSPSPSVRPTNGHATEATTAEQVFSYGEVAAFGNAALPSGDAPELPVSSEPTSPVPTDDAPEADLLEAAATPLEGAVTHTASDGGAGASGEAVAPPLEAAVTPTVAHEAALAGREPAMEAPDALSDQPPLRSHDAPRDEQWIPPHGGDDSSAAALVAGEFPAAPAGVADPPVAERVDDWVPEPSAPSNGIAVHAAATAEFPAVDHAAPALAVTELPTGEVNDIEVPLPAAADGAQATESDSAVMDVPFAAGATELIEAPTMEPGDGLATPFRAEPAVLVDPDIPAEPPVEPPAPPLAAAPPPPPAAPPPEEGEEEGATMTIIEHLEELRHRITISAISIVVGAVIGWFITPHLVQYLEEAFKKLGGQFLSLTILGPFGLELKLSFLIGFVIASPMVLYQIWGFVAPGLTRRERRYALPFSLIGSALFAGGALTGVLIVPLAIQFLTHFFQVLQLEQVIDIDKYIMFIALIAVIFGITFELPIFMVGFSLLGVVNSRFFIQKFRIAIFVIYGAAMVITPGADLVSPLVLGTFLIVLYWLGVLLIRVIGR